MDKNKLILSLLIYSLVDEYGYDKTQLINAMGDKYDDFLKWLESISNFNSKEFEQSLYKLFMEYVDLL